MAIEVVKVFKEHHPALRFIGMKYTNDDRKDGGFGEQWHDWIQNDRFAKLTGAVSASPYDQASIGLMTMKGDMTGFTYWVGLFFPAGTAAPAGYDFIDLPESNIGTGWVRGDEKSGEVFGGPPHEAVCKELEKEGIGQFRNDIAGEGSDTYCFYERYDDDRFAKPDGQGRIILDYGNYIK